jgi:hypothetical protein
MKRFIIFVLKTRSKIIKLRVRNYFIKKRVSEKILELFSLKKRLRLKRNCIKKDRSKVVVRLGWGIGKNGSRQWVGVGMRDEIKIINKYIYIYIYRLTVGNLTKRANGIYKNVSNI